MVTAVLKDRDSIEDAIRQAPGVVSSLWLVFADDEPEKPLFLSLDSEAVHGEMRRLRDLFPGRKYVCSTGSAKITRAVVSVPEEFVTELAEFPPEG